MGTRVFMVRFPSPLTWVFLSQGIFLWQEIVPMGKITYNWRRHLVASQFLLVTAVSFQITSLQSFYVFFSICVCVCQPIPFGHSCVFSNHISAIC